MWCKIENGVLVGVSRRQSIQYNEYREGVNSPDANPTAIAKIQRDAELQAMVFTVVSGADIQCRPQDKQVILDAIDVMTRNSLASYDWYAADNTWTPVTIADLENAIISGQDQGAAIWEAFRASGA